MKRNYNGEMEVTRIVKMVEIIHDNRMNGEFDWTIEEHANGLYKVDLPDHSVWMGKKSLELLELELKRKDLKMKNIENKI